MCGIAGVVPFGEGHEASGQQIRGMCEVMVHRGPDEEGIHVDNGIGLGIRRLAIIDLAGGSQPIFNEDRTVRVVFNGEIYNFRQLRADLESQGHRFTTASDTEVIVHLWEQHGCDFVKRLNGMFAIALHDSRKRKFVLARDHLGIKPLFYALGKDHLIFGSEPKVVLASGLVPRSLDLDALVQFLSWEYVPGQATLFGSIRKLKPAHLMEIDLGGHGGEPSIRTEAYWDLPAPPRNGSTTAAMWEERLDAEIRRCVRRQLVSDVPLGAFLSGGVDSSLVVAAMDDARTFSIGFDDPSYSELKWAQRVADHLGLDHKFELIESNVVDLFDHLMQFMDDPIGDFSIFPTYLVSRHARQFVKVALSGDGGDELFGGYETYLAQQKARTWGRLPKILRRGLLEPVIGAMRPTAAKKGLINKAKRFVEGLEHDEGLGHARWRLFASEALRRNLLTPEAGRALKSSAESHVLALMDQAGDRDACNRALYVDVKSYLVDNCLVKVDRMSMACGLETRVPLLDRELAELAFAIPSELKVANGSMKVLLKRVAARHVPRDCVYRPKEGFSIPIKHWLKTDFRPLLAEYLDQGRLESEGLFQAATIQRLKDEHLQGKANHSHVLWSLLVFQDWRRRWKV